jgi:O-antigen/teichoic acid export membrane protein
VTTISRSRLRGSIWFSVGRSAGIRMLILPISAILGIVNTRLIISHFGEASYAQYALLVGIGALIPFADLGISAAIVNVVAQSDDPRHDPKVRQTLTTCFRVLAGSTSTVLLITAIITFSGAWPSLLGAGLLPHSGPKAAGLCLAIVGVTLTVGFGQQVLAGLGKNHVSIALLGLQTPVVLLTLLLAIQFHFAIGSYVAVTAYAATFVIAAVAARFAGRQLSPAIGAALKDVPKIKAVPGGGVFNTAWPMLIQMIALPIAMQTDRLLLSHVSTLKQLSSYSLASQMFTPVWAVVTSAGIALWPIFAKARKNGEQKSTSPIPVALGFCSVAAVACLVIGLASPWLARKASDGEIHLSVPLVLTFSVFMIIQAAKFPLGMYMTDAKGLRFQAFMILILLPVNLGISWVLALRYGAVGPVAGSAVSVLGCQVIANYCYVRRDLAARPEPEAATELVTSPS